MQHTDVHKIELSQRKIIEAIEHELSLKDEFYEPQSMFHSVWFFPECGMFMYADCLVRHEVIRPLIENKTLVFKGVEKHQGELMPRYVLNPSPPLPLKGSLVALNKGWGTYGNAPSHYLRA